MLPVLWGTLDILSVLCAGELWNVECYRFCGVLWTSCRFFVRVSCGILSVTGSVGYFGHLVCSLCG